jgi:hypothetical protein
LFLLLTFGKIILFFLKGKYRAFSFEIFLSTFCIHRHIFFDGQKRKKKKWKGVNDLLFPVQLNEVCKPIVWVLNGGKPKAPSEKVLVRDYIENRFMGSK